MGAAIVPLAAVLASTVGAGVAVASAANAPKPPKPIPPPSPPGRDSIDVTREAQAAKRRRRTETASRFGISSTNRTSPLGLPSEATGSRKQLLGLETRA